MGFVNGLQSLSRWVSRNASRRPLLSCRFGWLGPSSSEPDGGLCPRLGQHLTTFLSLAASSSARRTTPTVCFGINSASLPPEWVRARASGRNRCWGVEHGAHNSARTVRERALGAASDRLEPATSERCSDRAPVLDQLPLGGCPSRCSHDLSPLRGSPAPPLGLRPPLMRLLRPERRHPKMRSLVALRHFRVSIRWGLGATL